MRFVATRGSMSVGASQGGLPPDRVVEGEDAIPADTRRVIERFHDKSHGAMVNVAVRRQEVTRPDRQPAPWGR